jgi:hypothetical protein
LLRHALNRQPKLRSLRETLIRLPTLLSAATTGFGMPILLFFPFDEALITPWMLAAGLPYYAVYARDLCRAGYGCSYVLRVYALNLLLIPALISGTVQSLRQAWSGQAGPFRRTPKTAGHTPAPLVYLLTLGGLQIYLMMFIVFDVWFGAYRHLTFNLFNSIMLLYALSRLIGLRRLRDDIASQLKPLALTRKQFVTCSLGEEV